jgi:hypothetical protein
MTMSIIKRLKRAAWSPFETFVDAIMERGFGVYSYPPPSPERVRSDPHGVLARARRRIDGADRMGPGSRHDAVDHEIEAWFLDPQQASWHCDPEPTSALGRPVFRCRHDARERAEAVSL